MNIIPFSIHINNEIILLAPTKDSEYLFPRTFLNHFKILITNGYKNDIDIYGHYWW